MEGLAAEPGLLNEFELALEIPVEVRGSAPAESETGAAGAEATADADPAGLLCGLCVGLVGARSFAVSP